ncbi:MAG: DUF1189 family protein [Candidatus Riflebacteria bacterium]|nr:DUF1189 family protein [Candidatus Riflebacteria bacterium]
MRRYSSMHALLLSFFSGELYRDVAFSWRGIGLLYLILLSGLCWIPSAIVTHLSLDRFVRNELPELAKQVPPMTLVKGKLGSPVPQPYIIHDETTKKPMFILDTTGKTVSLDNTPAMVLLTESKIFARQNKDDIRIRDLRNLPDFSLDGEKVREWAGLVCRWLAVATFPFVVAFSVAWGLFVMIALGVLGYALAGEASPTLSFGAFLRLAAVARTPAVVAGVLISTLSLVVPFAFLLYALADVVYMGFAVRAARETPPKPFDAGPDQPGAPASEIPSGVR